MAKRRFEYIDAKSSKFWEINASGKKLTICYGKIGTDGQTTLKELATPAEAKAQAEKLILEKTKKGYVELDCIGSREIKKNKNFQGEKKTAWQKELAAIYKMSESVNKSPNKSIKNYSQILSYARDGELEKLKYEFLKKISVKDLPDEGFELLCSAKNALIMEFLLSKGSSTISDDDHVVFAVIENCRIKVSDISALKKLCEYEGDLFFINNIWNTVGEYPIHVAVSTKNIEIIDSIINAGGDLKLRSNDGESPIGYAAKMNNIKLVRHLISLGSPTRKKDFYLNPSFDWSEEELEDIEECYPIEKFIRKI